MNAGDAACDQCEFRKFWKVKLTAAVTLAAVSLTKHTSPRLASGCQMWGQPGKGRGFLAIRGCGGTFTLVRGVAWYLVGLLPRHAGVYF